MELLLNRHLALGTAWWVEVNLHTEAAKEFITQELIARLSYFEARYSRFKTDSLVGRLNKDRAFHNPDAEFVTLLQYGQALHSRTAGAFNFLIGHTLASRGYGARQKADSGTLLPIPEQDIEISRDIIVLNKGSIDCGGFGKGYLIDELAILLRQHDIEEFLINGGGDLYVSHDMNNPIAVHLEHPTEADTYLGMTTLLHQGFAASSPYKRVWKHNNQAENHIVGTTRYASYVKAKSARDADAFATAALLLDDATLRIMATAEGLSVARFDPTNSEFMGINFDFTPLS
ncbi:FAD:protein FMN transferase [Patescibacteria group bacterium]|nr:FAD:protein FMN transferase [Patescibacteria group bacterium]